jgi:NhaP-type Na+/H+ or K+/H+ antiporter
VRLLGIGLPLTIAAGALAASALFSSFSLSEALILAVILAPTDAGLGAAVVTDTRLPQRVRQSLNVESGLNDGICVPILLIVLASASGTGTAAHPLGVLGEEIGYGLIGGGSAGLLAGYIVVLAGRRGLIDDDWRQLIPVAGATLAFGVAEALGGSGFIASFLAGVLYGLIVRSDTDKTMGYTEQTGALLDAVTFLVFGAVLLGPALEALSWQIVLYALLSLTVVRMLPVAIALWGTHARASTVAFIGWFGPRGLASIVFAVFIEDTHQAHSMTILTATYLTVGLSVLLHGLSAAPLVRRYVGWYGAAERHPMIEDQPAHEHRVRMGATLLLRQRRVS